jgi:hypothetical protein
MSPAEAVSKMVLIQKKRDFPILISSNLDVDSNHAFYRGFRLDE